MTTVVLVGNPNCGKTALFNGLTGARQRVGNWPGVTVEQKSGWFNCAGKTFHLVDLPGTYGLGCVGMDSETAVDEKITSEFLKKGEADIFVNVIDGSHLVRHLYLTLQLLELNVPVILAVNMMDIVQSRGLAVDIHRLAQLTGCTVVPLIANQSQGLDALKKALCKATHRMAKRPLWQSSWPPILEEGISALAAVVAQDRHLAVRLLEGDFTALSSVNAAVLAETHQQKKIIEQTLEADIDIIMADARYQRASNWADQVVTLVKTKRRSITATIDHVILNRFLAIPLFFLVMYAMFLFSIDLGGGLQNWFASTGEFILVDQVAQALTGWHFPGWTVALLANGLGKGINTVITFAPTLAALFFFLAVLESSGYMARAAFVMDRLMRTIGLPGNAFVPMIVGFGCNVPAVMSARTLSNPRDRILTILMLPFMSCGARLAIFAVFATAFFPNNGAEIIFLLYVLGIGVAIITGLVLKQTVLPGKAVPLVMELPSYHVPHVGALLWQTWHRLKDFLWRAGKYIVPICIAIGFLDSITIHGAFIGNDHTHSLLAIFGKAVTPVFSPMGIDQNNWPATVGLMTGVLAKEIVIGTLNALYTGECGTLYAHFNGAIGAFAYLVFVLLYFPCVSTMAAMRHEIGARWTWFSMLWSTGLAYALSVTIYQGLTWRQAPVRASLWIVAMIGAVITTVWILHRMTRADNKGTHNVISST